MKGSIVNNTLRLNAGDALNTLEELNKLLEEATEKSKELKECLDHIFQLQQNLTI